MTEDARQSRRNWIGPAAAISAAVLYGTAWIAAGVALQGFTPFTAALWRSVVTIVALTPLLLWSLRSRRSLAEHETPKRPLLGRLLRLTILGLLGGAGFGIGMNISILLTGVAITAFIAGAYPVVAAAAAPLVLNERIRPVAITGLILAFVGTLVIAGFDVNGLQVEGILVGVATAVGTGFFLLYSRKWSTAWELSSVSIAMSCFVLLAVAGGGVALIAGTPLIPVDVPLDSLLATLWLGIVAGAIATVLLQVSVRVLPASQSSAYLMLNPLTGALLAVALLGEVLSPLQIVGAACVLAGIGLATGTFTLLRQRLRPVPQVDQGLASNSPD